MINAINCGLNPIKKQRSEIADDRSELNSDN